jgi:hypothetical protein
VPSENWYVVEGTHEPVIDAETFQKARRLLMMNAKACTGGRISPLAGMLKCGECKKAMSKKAAGNKVYYNCRTYREKGKQFCKPHSIREDILFDVILEAINLQILRLKDVRGLMKRIGDAPGVTADMDHLKARKEALQKDLEKELAVFDRTYYDLTGGNISEEQFHRIRHICERRQKELKEVMESLSQEMASLSPATDSKAAYFERFQKDQRMTELTRKLAVDLIEVIYVYGDGSLEIHFRFSDPSQTA